MKSPKITIKSIPIWFSSPRRHLPAARAPQREGAVGGAQPRLRRHGRDHVAVPEPVAEARTGVQHAAVLGAPAPW